MVTTMLDNADKCSNLSFLPHFPHVHLMLYLYNSFCLEDTVLTFDEYF